MRQQETSVARLRQIRNAFIERRKTNPPTRLRVKFSAVSRPLCPGLLQQERVF